MHDLNSLLLSNEGWFLDTADGINDSGHIVGSGMLNGVRHAYLLTPTVVPVPPAIWLILSGALALSAAGRRWRGSSDRH